MITTINGKKFQSENIEGKGLCWIPVKECFQVGDILQSSLARFRNTRYIVCVDSGGYYHIVVTNYNGGRNPQGTSVDNALFYSLEELTTYATSLHCNMVKV